MDSEQERLAMALRMCMENPGKVVTDGRYYFAIVPVKKLQSDNNEFNFKFGLVGSLETISYNTENNMSKNVTIGDIVTKVLRNHGIKTKGDLYPYTEGLSEFCASIYDDCAYTLESVNKNIKCWNRDCTDESVRNVILLYAYFEIFKPQLFCQGVNIKHLIVNSVQGASVNQRLTSCSRLYEFCHDWLAEHSDYILRISDMYDNSETRVMYDLVDHFTEALKSILEQED